MQQEPELGRELFGYKKDDVDMLLAELHRDLRQIKEENFKLSSDLADAKKELNKNIHALPINELNIIRDKDGLIKVSFSELTDIQGVKAVWIFGDQDNILSIFDIQKLDLASITATLAILESSINRLESEFDDEEARLIFIEFNRIVLFLSPIKPHINLIVIASTNAPVGEILKAIDRYMPNLKKIFLET